MKNLDLWGRNFSYDEVRTLEHKPRLHHNGFVQLDLPDRVRLHVWPEHPPARPKTIGNIHDHVYGFGSKILFGSIQNIIYDFVAPVLGDGQYQLYQVLPYSSQANAPITLMDDRRYNPMIARQFTVSRGDEYRMEPLVFHETRWDGFAVSVVKIDAFDPALRARVAFRMDQPPDNDYKRNSLDPEVLWNYIRMAFETA